MQVTLHTNHGDITIKLFADKAPKTVANFVQYATDGFYDNTLFHRVISNFMVQGGGMTAGLEPKPTRDPIENEADNGLVNKIGTVAMARTNDPHSATAQFFVNVADNDFLNFRAANAQGYGYCVFGEVVEGMDVVEKIRDVKTTSNFPHQDVPVEDVVIESTTVNKDA
ncbi:MAG: peptidylprolyl isomerase [Idiomarina sp.]